MSGKSTYLSDAVLNEVFRSVAFAKPANVYVGLNHSDPTDLGLDTEITGGGYARVAVAVADASWSAPADSGDVRQITNANAIAFGAPTTDWNTANPITHFSLWDAASGGNLLYAGELGTPRTVLSGDNAPSFSVGALSISEG